MRALGCLRIRVRREAGVGHGAGRSASVAPLGVGPRKFNHVPVAARAAHMGKPSEECSGGIWADGAVEAPPIVEGISQNAE